MKRIFPFIIVLLWACNNEHVGKDGKVFHTAADYNEYIINKQSSFVSRYLHVVNNSDIELDTQFMQIDELAALAWKYKDDISKMPAFNGDTSFRYASENLMQAYAEILQKELKPILRYNKVAWSDTTALSTEEFELLIQTLNKKETTYQQAFANAQKAFAEKEKITLIGNQLQNEIDKLQ